MTLKAISELPASLGTIAKLTGEAGTYAHTTLSKSSIAEEMFLKLSKEEIVFQKVLAKLAVPAVVIGGVCDMLEQIEDEDYDAAIAITIKTAATVALMLLVSGIGWALIVGFAIEALWWSVSGYFIDSKIKKGIKRSLFCDTGARRYMLESLEKGDGFYLTRRDYREVPMQAENIHHIGNAKAVRDFIYKNYEANKKDFKAAAAYEMSSLYRLLNNVTITVKNIEKNYSVPDSRYPVNINGYLHINKEYFREIKSIWLIENDNYEYPFPIAINDAEDDSSDKLLNIFTKFKKNPALKQLEECSKNNYTIVIDSGAASVKYKLDIWFHKESDISYYSGNETIKQYHFTLNGIDQLPLTQQDMQLLHI